MKKKYLSILLVILPIHITYTQEFNLSAEIRPRFENKNGYKTIIKSDKNGNTFISQRNRLNLNYTKNKTTLRITLQNVRTWGDVNTIVENDNANSFHEAWFEYNLTNYIALKIGRQEVFYDDERIFGRVRWAQAARSHDIVIAKFNVSKNTKFDIGYALNNVNQNNIKTFYSNIAGYKTFQYLWYHSGFDKLGVSFLFLNNGVEYLKDATDTTSEKLTYSQTIGTRVSYNSKKIKANAATYFQFGTLREKNVNAQYFSGDLAYTLSNRTNITFGVEYFSGKNSNNNSPHTDISSFYPLYGTNHKFNGLMDYFYVGNHEDSIGLIDFYNSIEYKNDKLSLKIMPHIFFSAAKIYDTLRKLDDYLGTEIDFIFRYKISEDFSLYGGYSTIYSTDSLKYIKGGGDTTEHNYWTWLMLTFKPSLFSIKSPTIPN